ncbi:SDR family NAD(P)-dependent oxidoreductase [Pseudahrensia aquimaris]|uniref:SDR family NAD(P)-dependent oxidoreductase n=1 Tax=Pseudahrensia aquimaris TaxID=744461 RepID=A0ABW3FGW8_9HYPH
MKKVLITGASGGIGEAMCRYFEQRGYSIIAHARDEAKARAVTNGTERVAVWGDLTKAEEVDALAGQVGKAGPVDLLVHNAGILSTDKTLGANGLGIQAEVNVVAPARLTKALAGHMSSDDPTVVIVSSTAANFARSNDYTKIIEPNGSSLFGDYALSKAAANALTIELARVFEGMRILSTEPGFVKTKMTHTNSHMPAPLRFLAKFASSTPDKAAHRCFDHILATTPDSGIVVQAGKNIDSAKRSWGKEEAFDSLRKLLAKAGVTL